MKVLCLFLIKQLYAFNEDDIYKSRNLYDQVSMNMNSEVLKIIKGNLTKAGKEVDTSSRKSRSIIYNRVNKCGSTTLGQLLEDLGFQNRFMVVSHGLPKVRSLQVDQKKALSNLLCDPNSPRMVLSRHLNYVDWGLFGCDIMYFNQVNNNILERGIFVRNILHAGQRSRRKIHLKI